MGRFVYAIFVLGVLASCESGSALQLVSARVLQSDFPERPEGIGAWSDGTLVAWTPLDENGAGLLAIPAEKALELALTSASGRQVARLEVERDVRLSLRICRPNDGTIDLGEVRLAPWYCDRPADCRAEWEAVRDCRAIDCDGCMDCEPLEQVLAWCEKELTAECPASEAAAVVEPPRVSAAGCALPP
ncbi:MAG TPA: hypothetical protein VGD74_06010 [Vulgatibacter sp.]